MIILPCAVYTESFVLPVFKLSHFNHDKKYYNQNKCCYLCCVFFSPHCSSVKFSFHQNRCNQHIQNVTTSTTEDIQLVTSFYNRRWHKFAETCLVNCKLFRLLCSFSPNHNKLSALASVQYHDIMNLYASAVTQNARVRGHFWKMDAYECLENNGEFIKQSPQKLVAATANERWLITRQLPRRCSARDRTRSTTRQ